MFYKKDQTTDLLKQIDKHEYDLIAYEIDQQQL